MDSSQLPKPSIRPPDLPKVVVPPMPPVIDEPAAAAEVPPPGDARVKLKVAKGVGPPVETEEGMAPFNPRFLAALIDALMAAGVGFTLVFVLPGFLDWLGWVAGGAYLVLRDSLPVLGGRGIGKMAMNLRAVTLDGAPLVRRWQVALIRNGPLLIPPFFLVEIIVLLQREEQPGRRRRLGDEWAKTQVLVVPVPVEEE